MKTTRRILSMLLCLALVLGFVPALTMPAQAASGKFVKVTAAAEITTGQYVMISAKNYAPTYLSGDWVLVDKPTVSGDTVTNPENFVWSLTVDGSSVKLQDVNGKYIAPKGGNNNGIKNAEYSWNMVVAADATVQFKGIGSDTVIFACNNSSGNRIKAYKTTTANNENNYPTKFTLYKYVESTAPDAPSCDHAEGKMTWNNNETQHWKECECGNYSTTPADHDFTNSDTCVCGFDKPAVSDEKIYAKYTDSTLVTGEYILLTANGYAPGVVDGTWISAVQPKKSGENYTDANGGVWTVTVIDGDMVELKDAKGVVVGPKSKGIETGAGKKWKVICDSTADTFSFTSEDGQNYLASNHSQSYKFRAYAGKSSDNGYSQVFTLYKLVEATSETPAVPAFDSAAPVLKNDLAMNFYVPKAMFENTGYTNPYAVFNFDGKDYTVSTSTEATVNEVAMLVFTFKNIAPHKADTTITYTLKSTYNGEEVSSESGTYSVLEYCTKKLKAQDSSEKLKTLVSDLLNYCAAVQTSLGKTPLDTSAIEGFAPTTTEVTLTSCKAVTENNIENPVAAWDTATLILKDKVIVRFYFAAESIDGLSVKIAGAKNASITEIKQEGDLYYVDFTGLLATDMRKQITATVYSGDTAVSETVTYSIESYAASYQNVAANGMGALVKAMMKYGDSAENYQ